MEERSKYIMEENTYVADVIDAVDNKRACDEACKKVLALTEITSRILKSCRA